MNLKIDKILLACLSILTCLVLLFIFDNLMGVILNFLESFFGFSPVLLTNLMPIGLIINIIVSIYLSYKYYKTSLNKVSNRMAWILSIPVVIVSLFVSFILVIGIFNIINPSNFQGFISDFMFIMTLLLLLSFFMLPFYLGDIYRKYVLSQAAKIEVSKKEEEFYIRQYNRFNNRITAQKLMIKTVIILISAIIILTIITTYLGNQGFFDDNPFYFLIIFMAGFFIAIFYVKFKYFN